MNHTRLWPVVTLRASSLRSSVVRDPGRTAPRRTNTARYTAQTKKAHPAGEPFLFVWWAVLDSNQRPIG